MASQSELAFCFVVLLTLVQYGELQYHGMQYPRYLGPPRYNDFYQQDLVSQSYDYMEPESRYVLMQYSREIYNTPQEKSHSYSSSMASRNYGRRNLNVNYNSNHNLNSIRQHSNNDYGRHESRYIPRIYRRPVVIDQILDDGMIDDEDLGFRSAVVSQKNDVQKLSDIILKIKAGSKTWKDISGEVLNSFIYNNDNIKLLTSGNKVPEFKNANAEVVKNFFQFLKEKDVKMVTEDLLKLMEKLPNSNLMFFNIPGGPVTPTIFLKLIKFLKSLDGKYFCRAEMPVDLQGFFQMAPNINLLLEIIFTSKAMESVTFGKKYLPHIEILVKFLLKVFKNTARVSDLDPIILEIIMEQRYPSHLLPSFPDGLTADVLIKLVKFTTQVVTLKLNWREVPQNLMNFFGKTPDYLITVINVIFKMPVNKERNPNITPEILLKFIIYLKKRKLNQVTSIDVTSEIMFIINNLPNSHDLLPVKHLPPVDEKTTHELIRFINNIETLQLNCTNNLPPKTLIQFFLTYPSLKSVVEKLFETPVIISRVIPITVIMDIIQNIKVKFIEKPILLPGKDSLPGMNGVTPPNYPTTTIQQPWQPYIIRGNNNPGHGAFNVNINRNINNNSAKLPNYHNPKTMPSGK